MRVGALPPVMPVGTRALTCPVWDLRDVAGEVGVAGRAGTWA